VLLCGGCSYAEPGPLLDHAAWRELTPAEDPFEDRPEDVTCMPGGWGEEFGVFEVNTDECSYGTFAQELAEDLPPQALLRVTAWHLDLFAPEPAEAHVVVQLGPVTLLEENPAIPSEEAVWDREVRLEPGQQARAGDLILFHVHNHGANSWRLGAVDLLE